MSFVLIFRVEAEQDLEDIRDYYNKISPSITHNLFIEFFETMDFIEMVKLALLKLRGSLDGYKNKYLNLLYDNAHHRNSGKG